MLFVKITVLIIGMVTALAGMNTSFTRPPLLAEQCAGKTVIRPQPGSAGERFELMPVMVEEKPIARPAHTDFDIMEKGAYGFDVSGQWTAGPGPDGIPWGIRFSNSDALLLADVRPSVPEKEDFTAFWEDTQEILEQSAGEVFGKEVDSIVFYTQEGTDGGTVYVMEFTGTRGERSFHAAVCYCFGENYMAEFIGVNPYSAADCREITTGAALSFRELGGAGERRSEDEPGMGQENWPYPYLHNPFAIVSYYMEEA